MNPDVFSCPAKLNLLLAVTGRRADGFHELVSVVTPVGLADTLMVEPAVEFSLECDDPMVPSDGTNLVLKAAEAFGAATGWDGGAKFVLTKRIPSGAGLGGGSSDAAAALVALNRLAGGLLAPGALAEVAAKVGSDCPLFLTGGPVVIRGRGERVEKLAQPVAAKLRGRAVLVFKPGFAIATPWAFGQLAAAAKPMAAWAALGGAMAVNASNGSDGYRAPDDAEARLADFGQTVMSGGSWEKRLFNDLERVAFAKFVALPVLLGQLRSKFGLEPRMSGSGSACFTLLPDGAPVTEITATVREAWGGSALVVETQLT
ncbi:MAG: 4-(cytidine 5'-diphospho)-2-C-methyl-D-erythritol kinase [Opitutaceae bacterium]